MLLSLLSKRSLHDDSRDTYGFTVRPQHIHRYREYANIYKEEEEERLQKWNSFLEQKTKSSSLSPNKENFESVVSEVSEQPSDPDWTKSGDGNDSNEQHPGGSEGIAEVAEPYSNLSRGVEYSSDKTPASGKEGTTIQHEKSRDVQTWGEIRRSLDSIECMMGVRVKKGKSMKGENEQCKHDKLRLIEEERCYGGESEDDCKNADDHKNDDIANAIARESKARMTSELFSQLRKELGFLVQGGVPKDLRGEVWQAFVGVRTRRVEKYYEYLLAIEKSTEDAGELDELPSGGNRTQREGKRYDLPEKLKKQIEKDLPRTFPGHPALNDKGRNSLRRVLLAYARYNPSVGYCQAMNFFTGLLLLMMPEENAFWQVSSLTLLDHYHAKVPEENFMTLVGIMDDSFEGCFSEEMIESQVDQLVFEDLLRERFPKLVNHLDYLGVEVAWISGPWFLSIFVNMLPWESVLRVWDVLLFEGSRAMLFRTALALMDLYGAAVVTTKDAGDAVTLLQALAGSTFDSSQLVLTACNGFLTITEDRLQELRDKHRPAILAAAEEKAEGVCGKDPKCLATKLYSFKHVPKPIAKDNKAETVSGGKTGVGERSGLDTHSTNPGDILNGLTIDSEVDSLPDLQEQVIWLKAELCNLLEEKRSAMLRAEELEAAFMEMVKEDNRRELSARVEQLEWEVAELRQALADKKEGENAMLKVLVKVEQEQKITEEGRVGAEQDAAALRHALNVIQEKYEKATASMAEMEKRVVMAESMLAATLEYESGQNKAASSPRPGHSESPGDIPIKKPGLLSFGLGWRDRNKGKPTNEVASADCKLKNCGSQKNSTHIDTNT